PAVTGLGRAASPPAHSGKITPFGPAARAMRSTGMFFCPDVEPFRRPPRLHARCGIAIEVVSGCLPDVPVLYGKELLKWC
ncbi:hypothetical protein, partial [Streptomyces prasinopilosus]|uniref:hypothetical protein n=1 Tax=Streptomyces prasinopilosus TaxID=67344 RepID=UPI0019D141DD